MEKLKYIVVLVLVFMVSFVGGCCGADATTAEADEPKRMQSVETNITPGVCIVVDTYTGVQYLRTSNGGVCVMVDAEGKPLVDKGE